ncbi:head-tail connector protein, partial [Limimaricola sp.]
MRLIETGAVPEAALPIEGFRAHLRLGTGFAEDGLQDAGLAGFLRAAIAAIEARTGKVLLA